MGIAIVITSGKGGTGKTSVAGAVSSCLAAAGHKTLCIDCDIGIKNLDLTLGISDITFTDFGDVIFSGMALEEAVVAHPDINNLYLLSAPFDAVCDQELCNKFAELVTLAKNTYDYCIIDAPAGIGGGFKLAASAADRAIVVVTADTSSLRGGQRMVTELEKLEISDVRLLVNRVHPKKLYKTDISVDNIIDAVGARLIGIVSEDPDVSLSANLEIPLIHYQAFGAISQFRRIAGRIAGNPVPLGRF